MVNCSRPPVLDYDALADALDSGRLYAAAADVPPPSPAVDVPAGWPPPAPASALAPPTAAPTYPAPLEHDPRRSTP